LVGDLTPTTIGFQVQWIGDGMDIRQKGSIAKYGNGGITVKEYVGIGNAIGKMIV
jgi:hypothetical protein